MKGRTLLFISAAILAANLLFRLANQALMIWNFPLDGTDWSTHLFELWAFAKYGFHGWVPNWFGGYELFKFYTPGWYFLALPIYWLAGKVELAGYLSLLALFALGAASTYLLGKLNGFSRLQMILFYLFFFANALGIANFIRNGRVAEFTAWVVFIALTAILVYFKDRGLNWKFIFVAPLFAMLILSHFTEPILLSLLFLGFLLVKNNRERIIACATMLAGMLMTSFWLWSLLRDAKDSYITQLKYSERLLHLSFFENILLTAVVCAFLLAFYFYIRSSEKPREEFIFFLPSIIFAVLLFLKLTPQIPLFDRIYPHPAMAFLILLGLFFFFKSGLSSKPAFAGALLLVALASVGFNALDTAPYTTHNSIAVEYLEILPHISAQYSVLGVIGSIYPIGLCSYGPIYFNLNASCGWMPTAMSIERRAKHDLAKQYLAKDDCAAFDILKKTGTAQMVAPNKTCAYFKKCNLAPVYHNSVACLYNL